MNGDDEGRDGEGRGRMAENGDGQEEQTERPVTRSVAEWTTLGISAVVVIVLVGAALVEVFLRDDPAGIRISIEVALDEAEVRDGLTYVPFTVRNEGADAATDVVAVFEISQGETVVEETTVDIALLASHGTAQGELVTAEDLTTHMVTARVGATQTP